MARQRCAIPKVGTASISPSAGCPHTATTARSRALPPRALPPSNRPSVLVRSEGLSVLFSSSKPRFLSARSPAEKASPAGRCAYCAERTDDTMSSEIGCSLARFGSKLDLLLLPSFQVFAVNYVCKPAAVASREFVQTDDREPS